MSEEAAVRDEAIGDDTNSGDAPDGEQIPEAKALSYTIVPNGDRVLVKRWPDKGVFGEGTIVKAETYTEKTSIGEIVAVGPGLVLDTGGYGPMFAEVGMTVFFGTYAGNELPEEHFEKDMILMRDDEIMGALDFEKPADGLESEG